MPMAVTLSSCKMLVRKLRKLKNDVHNENTLRSIISNLNFVSAMYALVCVVCETKLRGLAVLMVHIEFLCKCRP